MLFRSGNDIVYHRRILDELGFSQQNPTVLYEDNMACIHLSKKDGQINRAKHIDTRVHRLRELVRENVLTLIKIPTADQVADIFTKALPYQAFSKQRSVLMNSV